MKIEKLDVDKYLHISNKAQQDIRSFLVDLADRVNKLIDLNTEQPEQEYKPTREEKIKFIEAFNDMAQKMIKEFGIDIEPIPTPKSQEGEKGVI